DVLRGFDDPLPVFVGVDHRFDGDIVVLTVEHRLQQVAVGRRVGVPAVGIAQSVSGRQQPAAVGGYAVAEQRMDVPRAGVGYGDVVDRHVVAADDRQSVRAGHAADVLGLLHGEEAALIVDRAAARDADV